MCMTLDCGCILPHYNLDVFILEEATPSSTVSTTPKIAVVASVVMVAVSGPGVIIEVC